MDVPPSISLSTRMRVKISVARRWSHVLTMSSFPRRRLFWNLFEVSASVLGLARLGRAAWCLPAQRQWRTGRCAKALWAAARQRGFGFGGGSWRWLEVRHGVSLSRVALSIAPDDAMPCNPRIKVESLLLKLLSSYLNFFDTMLQFEESAICAEGPVR